MYEKSIKFFHYIVIALNGRRNLAFCRKIIEISKIVFCFLLQIERELVLSIDKGLTKVPLMHEPRGNPGNRISNGIQLLPKQTGSIAPDHPPKQTQAWVRLQYYSTLKQLLEFT